MKKDNECRTRTQFSCNKLPIYQMNPLNALPRPDSRSVFLPQHPCCWFIWFPLFCSDYQMGILVERKGELIWNTEFERSISKYWLCDCDSMTMTKSDWNDPFLISYVMSCGRILWLSSLFFLYNWGKYEIGQNGFAFSNIFICFGWLFVIGLLCPAFE